jgi:class 3 adenylate cyclase
MAEHVLFVPGWGVSPRACDAVPAVHVLLDRLRQHFGVTVFNWPTVRGGPGLPHTVEGAVEALGESLPGIDHLVVRGSNVMFALLALGAYRASVRSIVCDGVVFPVATLEALGIDTMARAIEASMRIESYSPVQSAGARMQAEGSDEEAKLLVERMYADADWRAGNELWDSYSALNLLDSSPEVHAPTLVIESESGYPSSPEMREVLLRFAPNAEFVEASPWQLHEPASGIAFADLVIPFLQKHSARTVLATVLFADIVDSTVQATTLGDRRWSQLLGQFHALVGRELTRAGGRLVDTAGDGFMAVFDDPAAAIECASSVTAAARELGLEARAGVHTGQTEISGEKYSGVAVHTAARVCVKAASGEVLVSETVRQLLAGSSLQFEDRGTHELKGLPAALSLYAASTP